MHRKNIMRTVVFLGIASILSGCASYTVKPMPTLNPTNAANHLEKSNIYIAAKVFRTAHECRVVFSDNLVGGGYIPVEISLENMGHTPAILYRKNFLLSSHGKELSPADPQIVASHFSNSIVGGALLVGVFGVAAAEHANHKRDIAFTEKGLGNVIPLASGQVVSGFLYFKGKPKQILPAHLHITFSHNGKSENVILPVR